MATPDQTKDLGTSFPAAVNAGARTGVVIDGTPIDALGGIDTLPPELVGKVDMNDPAIQAAVQGWNGRSTSNAFTGQPLPPPSAPAAPAPTPTRSTLDVPTVPESWDPLQTDGTHDPITSALLAEEQAGQAPLATGAPGAPAAPDAPATPDSPGGQLPAPEPLADKVRLLLNGQQVEVDRGTLEAWGQLASWSQSLPQHVRQAYAGIESGDLIPVSRAELEQLIAQNRAAAAAPASAPVPTWDQPDPIGDPTATALAQVQAQFAALRAQVQQAPFDAQVAARAQIAEQQRLSTLEAKAAEIASSFQAERALTPQQLDALEGYIMNAQLVNRIVQERTLLAPNGQVISQPDPEGAIRAAYERAYETIAAFAGPAADQRAEAAVQAAQQQMSDVERKKTAQGAASSMPVAAVTLPERNVGPMAQHEMEAAIGDYLASLFEKGVELT